MYYVGVDYHRRFGYLRVINRGREEKNEIRDIS